MPNRCQNIAENTPKAVDDIALVVKAKFRERENESERATARSRKGEQ